MSFRLTKPKNVHPLQSMYWSIKYTPSPMHNIVQIHVSICLTYLLSIHIFFLFVVMMFLVLSWYLCDCQMCYFLKCSRTVPFIGLLPYRILYSNESHWYFLPFILSWYITNMPYNECFMGRDSLRSKSKFVYNGQGKICFTCKKIVTCKVRVGGQVKLLCLSLQNQP